MSWFQNMLAAASLGAFLLACFGCIVLVAISFWPECRQLRLRHVIRVLAGVAICILVGATFMQAFGLWIT